MMRKMGLKLRFYNHGKDCKYPEKYREGGCK